MHRLSASSWKTAALIAGSWPDGKKPGGVCFILPNAPQRVFREISGSFFQLAWPARLSESLAAVRDLEVIRAYDRIVGPERIILASGVD
jgi:hypothetical protein